MKTYYKKSWHVIAACLVMVLAVAAAWTVVHGGKEPAQQAAVHKSTADLGQAGAPSESAESTSVHTQDAEATADQTPSDLQDTASPAPSAGYVFTQPSAETDQSSSTIEEEVPYEPDVVLLTVAEGATLEEVNALIAQTGSVLPREVQADELESGLIELEVAEGSSVEDAMNALGTSDVAEQTQPNFIYYALQDKEGTLYERLAEAVEAPLSEAEPPTGPDATSANNEGTTSNESLSSPTEEEPAQVDSTEDEPGTAGQSESDPSEGASGISDNATDASESEDGAAASESDANDQATGIQALADDLPQLIPDDQLLEEQWALTSMRMYEAWAYATCNGAVSVAVVDEGPDTTHEDLVDNIIHVYDAYAQTSDIGFVSQHGTHVAGIVGARTGNQLGIAGISYNARLVLLNVFYEQSSTSGTTKYATNTSTLIRAYQYLLARKDSLNIRVINLSLGMKKNAKSTYSDDALISCINDAFDKGIVTVAAAGNSDLGAVPYYEYPGDAPNVVSVINLLKTSSGVSRSTASNYNVDGQTSKNISAPGSSIVSTAPDNSYMLYSGTSMATPQVAGVLALEFAANPSLTSQEAVDILYATARDVGDEGWDVQYGWGEVDACAAVKAAKAGEDPQLPDISDHETPEPKVSGPTRMPVGSVATFKVKDGSLKIKSGGSAAKLSGTTLTAVAEGMVTLSVLDNNGEVRATRNVVVYASTGTWVLQPSGAESYVLDVKGGSVLNSANVQIYTSNGKNNQVWLLESQGDGSFVVRSGKSGKVLDVQGGSTKSGANVILYTASGKAWQRWRMTVNADNSVTLTNANSSMALELAGEATNSRNVRQASPTGKKAQRWVLRSVTADLGPIWEGVYKVATSINKSYVLDVKRASTDNGGNVQLYRANGDDNQRWRFEYLGKDTYRIVNVNSGKVLDVARGTLKNSVNIDQWAWNSGSNQRWELVSYNDGSYAILRAGTSWAVDVKGAKAENGRNVHQYQRKDNAAQRWFLTQY